MNTSQTIQQLQTEWITPEHFRRYGQVIFASADGKTFDYVNNQ